MAAKKTASKKTTTKRSAGVATKKPGKPRFYATPNRLFAAAAAADGGLPKGTFVNIESSTPGGIDTTVRIGTKAVCVFEGTLRDLVTAALGKQKLKVKVDGEAIPSPATPPAPAASPSL